MKKFGAAVAALVVGASLFAAAPATALSAAALPATALFPAALSATAVPTATAASATASLTSTHAAAGQTVPAVATDVLPTIPAAPELDPTAPLDPPVVPSGDATAQSAPSDSATAAANASITGTVTRESGGVAARLPVQVYLRVGSGRQFVTQVITRADGSFTVRALAPGEYVVGFDDRQAAQNPSFQWFGQALLNPFGSPFSLSNGQSIDRSFQLATTGQMAGTLSCSTCTTPPDPATVTVKVAIYDPQLRVARILQTVVPDAEGHYLFRGLYPGTGYYIYAVYTGTGPFSLLSSDADGLTVRADVTTTQDTIVSYKLAPVTGIDRAVNSNVNALYWDYLSRLPSAAEVTFWGSHIQNGASPTIVAAGFVSSDEYRTIRIDAAYRTILGREPDPSGRTDWLDAMRAGLLTTDDIETSFYSSQEFYQQHGSSNEGFMAAIYQALLHRSGTASDYAFWGNLIDIHGRAWVVDQFWRSTETISERVSAMYALYLGRTPDAAGLAQWVSVALQIGDSGLRAGISGSPEYLTRSQLRFAQ